jgi:hypothetical protein
VRGDEARVESSWGVRGEEARVEETRSVAWGVRGDEARVEESGWGVDSTEARVEESGWGVHSTEAREDEIWGVRSEERLIRRQLALRQYVEMRRTALGCKATSKPWRLAVRRGAVLDDGLHAFGGVSSRKRSLLFGTTAITFRDEWGDEEEGQDHGGLTAEMLALFWESVRQPESGLFCGERLLLPSPLGSCEQLEAVRGHGSHSATHSPRHPCTPLTGA